MKLPPLISGLLGTAKGSGATDNQVVTLPPDIFMTTQTSHLYNSSIYRLLLKIALAQAVLAVVLITIVAIIMLMAKPTDRFYVSAVNGRLERVMPLDTPTLTGSELLSQVADNVASALTFGYIDQGQRYRLTTEPFATGVHEALLEAIFGKDMMGSLVSKSLVFKSALDVSLGGGLLQEGRDTDNIYKWQLQIPIMVEITSGNKAMPDQKIPWHVIVKVERSKILELGLSYQITQILGAKQAGPAQIIAPEKSQTP